jgi:omega-6 fatty acid desaturase (delta-12 desaturase)
VLFGLGPVFIFVIKHRFPWRISFKGRTPVASVVWTNLGIGAAIGTLIALFGGWPVLLTQGPITLMASAVGTWLFYIQHQFENTHWEAADAWRFEDAALHGSSYYDLPAVLDWFTAHIGVHHIHHLCSRIPNYRLRQCLADNPALREQANRLTFRQSLHCARLTLWDEASRQLVSFREARRRLPA